MEGSVYHLLRIPPQLSSKMICSSSVPVYASWTLDSQRKSVSWSVFLHLYLWLVWCQAPFPLTTKLTNVIYIFVTAWPDYTIYLRILNTLRLNCCIVPHTCAINCASQPEFMMYVQIWLTFGLGCSKPWFKRLPVLVVKGWPTCGMCAVSVMESLVGDWHAEQQIRREAENRTVDQAVSKKPVSKLGRESRLDWIGLDWRDTQGMEGWGGVGSVRDICVTPARKVGPHWFRRRWLLDHIFDM